MREVSCLWFHIHTCSSLSPAHLLFLKEWRTGFTRLSEEAKVSAQIFSPTWNSLAIFTTTPAPSSLMSQPPTFKEQDPVHFWDDKRVP